MSPHFLPHEVLKRLLAITACALGFLITPNNAAAISEPVRWVHQEIPSVRDQTAVVYDSARNVMVLQGGESAATGITDTITWEWDGSHWGKGATLGAVVRLAHSMAYDSIRHVTVLFGGNNGPDFGDTWEYDGTTWTQKVPVGPSPSPRYGSAMAFDEDRGVVVLFAGQNSGGDHNNETWEWNGTSWTQRTPAESPPARSYHALAYDSATKKTVLFGGGGDTATWEWDGSTWTKYEVAGPSARVYIAMAYDRERQRTVLFGGSPGVGSLADTWLWNGATKTWAQSAAVAPYERAFHAMTYDTANNRVLLYGGYSYDGYGAANKIWAWDGSAWSIVFDDPIYPRWDSAVAYDSDRGVPLLFGGMVYVPYSYYPLNDLFEYTTGGSWTIKNIPGPSVRYAANMGYDSTRQEAVLFGGIYINIYWNYSPAYSDTWVLKNGAWEQKNPATVPPGRGYAATAFHADTNTFLMFSGWAEQGGFFPSLGAMADNTLWKWNGTDWSSAVPADGGTPWPSARFAGAMAYDSTRKVSVLFGGYTAGGLVGDTWEWNGTSWTDVTPVTSPSARYHHKLVYDQARHVTILFGGYSAEGRQNDTWEWNGTTWRQIDITGPSTRFGSALTYDAQKKAAVLYGGTTTGMTGDGGTAVGETWELQLVDNDSDGVPDLFDNCPAVANASQTDGDSDGVGDSCDNCSSISNANQTDTDSDLIGDVCDNCIAIANTNQADSDGDGLGNLCDNCPAAVNVDQSDSDGDSVGDTCDNCPSVSNSNQADSDSDLVGNACDACGADPGKSSPGLCGCGLPDVSTTSGGCLGCDSVPNSGKVTDSCGVCGGSGPGVCGCGLSNADSDGDGIPDCNDACPQDRNKTAAGVCGCGVADADANGNSIPDCNDPVLTGRVPPSPKLTLKKTSVTVSMTPLTGVKYAYSYRWLTGVAKKDKAIKPKLVISQTPLASIRGPKIRYTLEVSYHYALGTSQSLESKKVKLKVTKLPKK